MAIIKQVWNARLVSHGDEDATAELAVVRQDRNDETLFSIVEATGPVRRRVTFSLSSNQAVDLARFLAGISAVRRVSEIDDEKTPTTLPGRPPGMLDDPEPVD